MFRRANHRSARAIPLPGFLIALICLVSQIAIGTLVIPDDTSGSQLAALTIASIDCHASPASAPGGRSHHPHRQTEPAVCPLRLALELPGVTLLPPVVIPESLTATAARVGLPPPSRGPPPAPVRVGQPRAPPVLT